jgi:hypothetical protein
VAAPAALQRWPSVTGSKPTAPTSPSPGFARGCTPRTGTTEYGCYCGAGNSCGGFNCTPVDELDACCRQHDIDYGGCKFEDRFNPFHLLCYGKVMLADAALCVCTARLIGGLSGAARTYAVGVLALFCRGPRATGIFPNPLPFPP